MTQPDQLAPETAITDVGLAALANKTQEDWDTEIRGSVTQSINPLNIFLAALNPQNIANALGLGEEFAALKEAFDTLFEPLRPILESLNDLFTDTFTHILEGVGNFYEWITVNIGVDLTKLILNALKLIAQLGNGALTMLVQLAEAMWNIFQSLGGNIVIDAIKKIIEFFANIIETVGSLPLWRNSLALVNHVVEAIGRITGGVFTTLENAMTGLGNFFQGFGQNVGSLLQQIVSRITGFAATGLQNPLNALENFFAGINAAAGSFLAQLVARITGQSISSLTNPLQALQDFFGGLVAGAGSLVQQIVSRITGIATSLLSNPLQALQDFFAGLVSGAGSLLQQIVSRITGVAATSLGNPLNALQDFFAGITAGAGSLISQIVEAITGVAGNLTDLAVHFLTKIPLIGPLVYALTGRTQDDPDGAPDLGTIGAWAANVLTVFSNIPGANIIGNIASAVLGVVPVANIANVNPNLISQYNFQDAETLDAARGWTWDSTQNYTGTDAGSAKLDVASAPSGVRALFSNQNVPVAAGDRLQLSAYIKSASFTGSSTSIEVSLVTFAGDTQLSTITLGNSGASTAWKQIKGTYTVPSADTNQITSVLVRLAVNADASSGQVWFDNISLTKQGLMGQSLVDRLLDAWLNVWNGLFGSDDTTARNVDDVKVATDLTRDSIAKLQTAVTQIQSSNSASGFAGRTGFVNFSTYAASSPALLDASGVQTFAQTYPNPGSGASGAAVGASTYGSGTLGLANGVATWVNPSTSEFRDGFARYIGAPGETTQTLTDYQKIGCAFSSVPYSNGSSDGFNYICGRMNAPSTQGDTNFVYLKLGATLCELWHVSNGSHQRLRSTANFRFKPGASYYLECGRSTVVSGERIFRWFENGIQLDSYTDSALVTKLGANYRYAGFGMHYAYYRAIIGGYRGGPGNVAAFAYYDNIAAATIGSGYRIIRPETTTVPLSVGTGMLPASFFTQKDIETEGYTWTASNNSIRVSIPGWYMVDTRVRVTGLFATSILSGSRMTLDLYRGGTTGEALIAAGDEAIGVSGGGGGNQLASGTFMVYLNTDEYVRLGYTTDRAVNILGEGSGTRSYFSITFLGNTKPKKPE